MSDLTNFDIRFSELEDHVLLKQWFSVEGACDDFPFGPEEMEEALKNWIGFSKFRASLTGVLDGAPCAIGTLFLMPYKKVAHQCSFYLFVDPMHRREGIGTSMVRNLMNLAKTRFSLESINVELYEPCHLAPLLEKLGFQLIARQQDFMHIRGCSRSRILLEHSLL